MYTLYLFDKRDAARNAIDSINREKKMGKRENPRKDSVFHVSEHKSILTGTER